MNQVHEKKFDDTFRCFDAMSVCDGRTDKHIDKQTDASCDIIVCAVHTRCAVKTGQNLSIGISRSKLVIEHFSCEDCHVTANTDVSRTVLSV